MATTRILRPLTRQTPRLLPKYTSLPTKRLLNTETAPVLFTSHATVSGGRAEGKVTSDHLNISLDMPKDMGGAGKHANPEELFAAGYGACFQGAMALGAQAVGVKLPGAADFTIETAVHLVGNPKEADMLIRVDMKVKAKGIGKEDLEKVVRKTKEICPYSRAVEGNVITNVQVEVS